MLNNYHKFNSCKTNDSEFNASESNDSESNDSKSNDSKSNDSKSNDSKSNDSKSNASESNDSKSFCQGIFDVHIIANQFGFNDRIIKYLDTVLDHEAVPYYGKVMCRISHVSNSKFEDIDKPKLFTNYKCALYAICKVLLKDHLEGLSEDHDKKEVEKRLDTFNKHVLAELFGYEKLLFDAYEFKADELIKSEKTLD